jgi:hypothetical protein
LAEEEEEESPGREGELNERVKERFKRRKQGLGGKGNIV